MSNARPVALAGGTREVRLGREIEFDGTRSHDPDGRITDYTWNFGDGKLRKGARVQHRYKRPGTYFVSLTVRDHLGYMAQDVSTVRVRDGDDSPPYKIVEEETWIPLRDGVRLHTKIRRPAREGRYPAVVEYEPYIGWQLGGLGGDLLVENGYVVVLVQVRGRGKSGGTFDTFGPLIQRDILDIDQWLAAQPWSDGQFGMYGHSAPGLAAFFSYSMNPPHMKCIWVNAGRADLMQDAFYPGGVAFVPYLNWIMNVLSGYNPDGFDIHNRGYERVNAWMDTYLGVLSPIRTPFWQDRRIVERLPNVDIPACLTTSWHDVNQQAYLALANGTLNDRSKVIVYPGLHYPFDPSGEYAMPALKDAVPLNPSDAKLWYDYWMKGIDTGVADRPHVTYFHAVGGDDAALLNGEGYWSGADRWPPIDRTWHRLHLWSEPSQTSDAVFDGSLGTNAGGSRHIDWPFLLDSHRIGTRMAFAGSHPDDLYGKSDERRFENRWITFTTPPLATPLTFAGPPALQLWVKTELADAEWMARLYDVWPDGSIHHLTDGYLRAATWRIDDDLSVSDPSGEIVEPVLALDLIDAPAEGEWRRYMLPLRSAANTLPAGHRLRVSLSFLSGRKRHADDSGQTTIGTTAEVRSQLILPILGPEPQYGSPTAIDTQARKPPLIESVEVSDNPHVQSRTYVGGGLGADGRQIAFQVIAWPDRTMGVVAVRNGDKTRIAYARQHRAINGKLYVTGLEARPDGGVAPFKATFSFPDVEGHPYQYTIQFGTEPAVTTRLTDGYFRDFEVPDLPPPVQQDLDRTQSILPQR